MSPVSIWPSASGTFDRTAIKLADGPQLGSQFQWMYPSTPPQERSGPLPSLVAWGDLVFVRSAGIDAGDVVALEADTGKLRWRTAVSYTHLTLPTAPYV